MHSAISFTHNSLFNNVTRILSLVSSPMTLKKSAANLNSSLFTHEGDSYVAPDELVSTLGFYFDNGFIGVQSGAFESGTTTLAITLDSEGDGFTVETGFEIMGEEYFVRFELSDINSTELPSYFLETWN